MQLLRRQDKRAWLEDACTAVTSEPRARGKGNEKADSRARPDVPPGGALHRLRSARFAGGTAMKAPACRIGGGQMRILAIAAIGIEIAFEHSLHCRWLDAERLETGRAIRHDIVAAKHLHLID